MIGLALLIAAFVLFVLAAVGVPSGRFSLMAAGLACWSLAEVIGTPGIGLR
jgi:hypothetical protein